MSKLSTHSKLQDMHPADIKAALEKRGATLADLARHHGYKNPRTLNNALRVHWPKAEKLIADFLDMRPEDIWPSRYQKKSPFASVNSTKNKQNVDRQVA